MIPTDSDEQKQTIRQLAFDWARLELPTRRLSYTDYLSLISGLHTITGDATRTSELVTAVLNQAARLGRSSDWVERELKFEAKAEAVGDRSACLRADLEHNDASDAALDRYNERQTRFCSHD